MLMRPLFLRATRRLHLRCTDVEPTRFRRDPENAAAWSLSPLVREIWPLEMSTNGRRMREEGKALHSSSCRFRWKELEQRLNEMLLPESRQARRLVLQEFLKRGVGDESGVGRSESVWVVGWRRMADSRGWQRVAESSAWRGVGKVVCCR